ncbi:MAG TPA: hypothetical protein ENH87_03510 [Pricia antarctica]|uniref:Uncharacterized protein n=1 Tax=Pricia antarctica TaxID=641691 RepID=A0A831VMP1_9FLAO|nr:hypothetical protein [Pricia antarctica]
MSPSNKIEGIISALPDESKAFTAELLYNNVRVSHRSQISAQGRLWSNDIGFTLTPQDANLKNLLDDFNNEEVVVLLSKRGSTHLYGFNIQPLLFTYDELNSPLPTDIKGYSISISGNTYGSAQLYESVELDIYERGLAFELADQL